MLQRRERQHEYERNDRMGGKQKERHPLNIEM